MAFPFFAFDTQVTPARPLSNGPPNLILVHLVDHAKRWAPLPDTDVSALKEKNRDSAAKAPSGAENTHRRVRCRPRFQCGPAATWPRSQGFPRRPGRRTGPGLAAPGQCHTERCVRPRFRQAITRVGVLPRY